MAEPWYPKALELFVGNRYLSTDDCRAIAESEYRQASPGTAESARAEHPSQPPAGRLVGFDRGRRDSA